MLIHARPGRAGLPACSQPMRAVCQRDKDRRAWRPASPSLVAGRPPCCRRCSRALPESGGWTAARGSCSSGVGFSYGCAELTLKKPPPLVPSCLIAICEAAGPIGKVCVGHLGILVTSWPAASFSGLPQRPLTVSVIGRDLRPPARRHRLEVLHHALRHQRQRHQERERHQHVKRAARHIHPEVTDAVGAAAREAAHDRQEHRDAGRRRKEVLHRQGPPSGSGSSWCFRRRSPASWCWW